MKKMMFNDRYCLTQAVIEGRKTMTRRGDGINPYLTDVYDNSVDRFNRGHIDYIELIGTKRAWAYKPRYKVGEIVAVAQSYNNIFQAGCNTPTGLPSSASENKMFVRANLMPHQIRITGVRAERLQDITEEDCLREYPDCDIIRERHVNKAVSMGASVVDNWMSRRDVFAWLIDKISGKGTWERNPWVWVYEFELVK